MTTTTSYGTWNNRVQPFEADFETGIVTALGDYADDYDIDAVAADYRTAINEALPASVSLCGSEFIGPYYDADFDGYPTDDDGRLDIKAIVDSVDFWEIAAKHETTNDSEESMTMTLVSATQGDRVPGVEISDPASPIRWDDLPAEAQQWATEQGYGEDDSELLYVVTDDEAPAGFPSFTLPTT